MRYLLTTFAAYLFGSIPFGYLAGRVQGVDVREHGSGNIGATNVLRVFGKKWGYFVFLGDTLKGLLAVRLALWINGDNQTVDYVAGILAATASVVGHSFPIWLHFRGGKGVATAAGACLGLFPLETLVAIAVWCGTFLVFRFVSLASVAAATALPASVWFLRSWTGHRDYVPLGFTILTAALIILRHRTNILRLFDGTEPRFERK